MGLLGTEPGHAEHPAGSSCRSLWLQGAVCPPPPTPVLSPHPRGSNKDPRLCNDPQSPPLPPIAALGAGARESFTCELALWSGAELTWPWAGCTWPGVPECVCAGGEAAGPGWGGASGDTEETGEGWGHPAAGMPCGMGARSSWVPRLEGTGGVQGHSCVLRRVQLSHTHTHAHADTHTPGMGSLHAVG